MPITESVMAMRFDQCGQEMSYGPADIVEQVRGVRVRMRCVPAWTCPACGRQQVTLPVARYLSEYLRRLLADPPTPPQDLEHPLLPTEVVFTSG